MYNNYNQANIYYTNYVDDYLRNIIGKQVECHVSFSDSIEWRDSIFKGILENVGKDYIVISKNIPKYIGNIF